MSLISGCYNFVPWYPREVVDGAENFDDSKCRSCLSAMPIVGFFVYIYNMKKAVTENSQFQEIKVYRYGKNLMLSGTLTVGITAIALLILNAAIVPSLLIGTATFGVFQMSVAYYHCQNQKDLFGILTG